MKSIVVYRIAILTCLLVFSVGLMAQKPAIDLISTHHQYRHPEAIMDTGYTVNPSVRKAVLDYSSPAHEQKLKAESEKKKRRQIGPSLDSLFQNEESKTTAREKSPMKLSVVHHRYNPIKLLLYITALK